MTPHYRNLIVGLVAGTLGACGDAPSVCPEHFYVSFSQGRCVPAPPRDVKVPTDAEREATAPAKPDARTPMVVLPDDGGVDTDAQPNSMSCSVEDVQAWKAFHQDPDSPALSACLDPRKSCQNPPCTQVDCLRAAVGVVDCKHCVEREVDCILYACRSECLVDQNGEECRRCACREGCAAVFEECAETELGLCGGCEPGSDHCNGLYPWPAILVPILF